MKQQRTKRLLIAAATVAVVAAALAWYYRGSAPLVERVATLAGKNKATAIGWPVAITLLAGDGVAGFADGAGTQARFSDPFGVALDRAGNLYVADAGENNRIRKLAPNGMVSTLAGATEGFTDGAGVLAAFHTPSGLAIDKAGNLYVADTGNHAIRKVTPQGEVSTLAGNGTPGFADGVGKQALFNGPVGVAVDQAGNVLVADTYNDRIRRIAPDGTVVTIAGSGTPGLLDGPGAIAMLDTPSGIAIDAKGVIYVADTRNGAIRRLGVDGMLTTLARAPDDTDDPLLRRPLALTVTRDGFLYVADMARGRILQVGPDGQLHGLTGIKIDIAIGDEKAVRFSRPAGIALGQDGELYVADAVRRVVRKVAARDPNAAPPGPDSVRALAPPPKAGNFPWPFAPQYGKHEVVGIVGEVRGSYNGESRHHFHNGLDIQANMGVPVLAVASEKVSSPLPNSGFGDLGEGLSLDTFSYIHMRVGRTLKDVSLDTDRFALLRDAKGKPERVRVRRGTRFMVGDPLGSVNRMFHVHLIQRTPGGEANPLALPFTGLTDNVVPRISAIELHDQAGTRLMKKEGKRLLVERRGGPLAIVVDAYDQADGNAARRKLGLYKVGYQLLDAQGVALPGYEQPLVNIEFNQLPPDPESVKVAYADKSGITVYGSATTRFLYSVTNTVRDGAARSGSWDPAALAPGDYVIRIFAADFAGNQAEGGRDLAITVR
ncbi:MAG: NHL repeat-containing protein [Pseudomonadota bacterium]